MKKFGKKSIICDGKKKVLRIKSHILNSKKWHNYCWVYNGKISILYVDGKVFKKNMPMTISYWFNIKKNRLEAGGLDELRIRILHYARGN